MHEINIYRPSRCSVARCNSRRRRTDLGTNTSAALVLIESAADLSSASHGLRSRRSHRARAIDRTPANAFGYLLREPRHAWHQRWMNIAVGILMLAAIACARCTAAPDRIGRTVRR